MKKGVKNHAKSIKTRLLNRVVRKFGINKNSIWKKKRNYKQHGRVPDIPGRGERTGCRSNVCQ